MTSFAAAMKARREALGIGLDDLSNATSISVEHLAAIEDGREDSLPKGPYLAGYRTAIAEVLEIDEAPDAEIALDDGGISLAHLRWVAIGLAAVFLGLVLFRASEMLAEPGAETEVISTPDQRVRLTADRTTKIRVTVDGEVVFDGPLAGGKNKAFEGHDEVEVWLSKLSDIRVRYNDQKIRPQGRQDRPRTLVFKDDGGGT